MSNLQRLEIVGTEINDVIDFDLFPDNYCCFRNHNRCLLLGTKDCKTNY